jgi:hypothetical protein
MDSDWIFVTGLPSELSKNPLPLVRFNPGLAFEANGYEEST